MADPMTDARLNEIEARAAAPENAPFRIALLPAEYADFVTAARKDIPELTAEIRRLRAGLRALQQLFDFHTQHLAEAGAVIQAQADALAEDPQHEAMAAVGRVHAERIRGLIAVKAMWDSTT